MSRVMRLTSPHMKGKQIAALQRLLKEKGYLEGKVDHEYGPDTARAVYRAKYALGYPKPDKIAGDKLYGLLSGRTKPTLDMRTRARRRLKKPKKSIGLKMLEESVKYLGLVEEPPGSNNVLFSRWYGVRGPWCAMFCSFCGVKIGSKAFKRGQYYAYCPFIFADAQRGRNGLMLTYRPQDGNMVLYDWQALGRRGVADHVGLWASERTLLRIAPSSFAAAKRQFGALGKGDFWAVEGNTGVGNDSNGGEVMIRKRNKANVQGYVEVRR